MITRQRKMDDTQKRMFLRFLRDKHIRIRHNLYYINHETSMKHNRMPYQDFIKCKCATSLISQAFLWDKTKEGFVFWANLHSELNHIPIQANNANE